MESSLIGLFRSKQVSMYCCVMIAATWICALQNALADEATKNRVLKEYPEAARFISESLDQCRGSYRFEWDEDGKKTGADVTFSRSYGFEKFEISSSKVMNGKTFSGLTVYCVDKSTAFVISRFDNEEKWKLNKTKLSRMEREMVDVDYARVARCPLGGYQKSLITMINDGSATLIDASISQKNANLLEATFKVDDTSPLKQIKAVFDTTNHWAITREIIYVGEPLRLATEFDVEYGNSMNNSLRLPVSFKTQNSKYPHQFKEWKFGEVPMSEFQLTHYQLPDVIAAAKPKSFNRFDWMLIAIIGGFLILGSILYKYSRSTAKKSAESSK
jgi:hypothetical protein